MRISDWSPDVCSSDLLNRYSATRRVARAVFMGTAPTHQQQNTGLDDKQINLGVVQPGERPTIFGDALRRLTNQAKFMHADLGRYWYSMSASLNRIAADRAAQLERSEEHTSELQSLMRISYAVFCLKKKNNNHSETLISQHQK